MRLEGILPQWGNRGLRGQPILDREPGDAGEMPDVPGGEDQAMLEGDGRDAQVRFASRSAAAFERGFEAADSRRTRTGKYPRSTA